MKAPYEKPVIVKAYSGLMNKFGTSPFYAQKIRSAIDGFSVESLVAQFGSPLFVFSERSIRRKFREVHGAFSTRYPNTIFGWSYKTNYLQAICLLYHREGSLAEVVSEMEYDKARKLERKLKVGMRLNMDTGIYPQWSRFGFNLDSGQARDAIKRITTGGTLTLTGFHCHMGTFILDPRAYALEVKKMVEFGYQVEKEFRFAIEYYDIGGGFPSKSRLKGVYLSPDLAVPSIEEYAEKISEAFYAHLRPGDFPRLILEAGRSLIDEAGYLITSMRAAKRMPDGRRSYVLGAGINMLFTSQWYKFTVELEREVQGVNEPSVLYGPLCMNIDVVDEGIELPPLPRGLRLTLSPVGAYNTTQWMQFFEHRPPVVLIGEKGEVDVIREGEDLSDIERREQVPGRLRLNRE